jgi:AcrR family transcriptional regulator
MSAERYESDGAKRLLEVAARYFGANGYEGTSVREILRDAGVGPTVLYYHFRNKEGLYDAARRRIVEGYDKALDRAASGADSVADRIERACRVHVDWKAPIDRDGLLRTLKALVLEGIENGEVAPCDSNAAAAALAAASSEPAAVSFILEKLR